METIDVVPSVKLVREGPMWHLSGLVDLDLGAELMPDPLGEDPAAALANVDEHEQLGWVTPEDAALLDAADAWLAHVETIVLVLADRLTQPAVDACCLAGWNRRQGNAALWLYARAARLAAA
ncbi:MAG: hypothetical protein JWL70_1791 [Acidimicrobiia bacterium]|nr:hypothetical protein [Acidimicrobiia bacterium]